METINRTLKVIVLLLMLVGFAPSASVTLTATKAAVTANQAATGDELEAMKKEYLAALENCMRYLNETYNQLREKATEDEARELYERFYEIEQMIRYSFELIERAASQEELAEVEYMLNEIMKRLDELHWQIENLFDFTANTVDGIKLLFKVISEEDKTVEVTGIGSHEANCTLTIPETVEGYTVISIKEQAFEDSEIGSVVIPKTMKSISSHAFFDCWKLTSVTIPNSVTSIEGQAFYRCTSLTSVDIPSSVTYIGIQAFWQCSSLTSVIIPNSVTSIESSAFEGCSALTSVNIPSSVTSISRNAFNGTGWYNSQSDGLLYLDGWLLGYKGNQPTGELTIAEGTKGIARSAFSQCSGITSVTIPSSMTYINDYAFSECSGLTSFTIPISVTTIGRYAFSGCSGLTSVTALMKEPFAIPSNVFSGDTYNSATLYVPQGTKVKYWLADGWKLFNEVVERNASYSYDVNGDGEVNSADINCLVNKILGINDTGVEPSYTSCPDDHHPHLIDLGLPSGTKWACCNLGATKPDDYGGYYAWGETEEKDVYDWSTYIHYSPDSYTNIQESDISGTEYDAATANWGVSWRMPSLEQIMELMRKCSSVWTTRNGVNGRLFTGPNGGTLFLPAAGGYYGGSELHDLGVCGLYRSSTHYDDAHYKYYAHELYFNSDVTWNTTFNCYHCNGLSVRSVQIEKSYDVNGDGEVNIADVTLLVDRIPYLERLKTLESGSADEVRTVLEEMSGVNQANAGEVANTLQENANVIEAFTEDGNNVVVRQDEEEGYRVYPMYHLESLFSDDVLTSEVEIAMARSSQRRTVHYDQKIAIFNYFGSASATSIYYPTQNRIMSCLTAWFNNHGYTTEVYGDSPQKPFTVENLQKVVDEWVNYKAIIIMTHGAVVENKTPFFAVHELIEKKRDNGFVDPDDKKVYKIVSVEDMFKKVGRGCYIYLGACDGAPKGGYQHIDDLRFPMLSNTDIIGWSGKTRIAQAHAALLFHSLLYGGYTWGQVWQGITSQDGTAQAHPSYHMQESVSPFTFAGNDDIKTEYDNSVSASVFVNQVKDKDMVNFKITVEGFDYPCEIKGNIVNLINGTKIAWNKKIYNSSYNSFNKQLPLSALADGIYSLEILAHPDDNSDHRRVKLDNPACFIKSKFFKELGATVVSEADVTAPLILGTDGQAVDEITLAAGSSATFTLDAYSGHTFETPCLDKNVATVSLSGTTLTVTGASEGTTYFGVYDVQNRQTAVVMVMVEPSSGNHDWVDLGLPSGTLWATCNVGANSPEEYGGYYTFDEAQEFNPPTLDQIQELLDNTTSEWTTLNGVNGRKFTGSNGGNIFLPAAGNRWDSDLNNVGSYGSYWSSTLYESYPNRAFDLYFCSDYADWNYFNRNNGQSVRPVR